MARRSNVSHEEGSKKKKRKEKKIRYGKKISRIGRRDANRSDRKPTDRLQTNQLARFFLSKAGRSVGQYAHANDVMQMRRPFRARDRNAWIMHPHTAGRRRAPNAALRPISWCLDDSGPEKTGGRLALSYLLHFICNCPFSVRFRSRPVFPVLLFLLLLLLLLLLLFPFHSISLDCSSEFSSQRFHLSGGHVHNNFPQFFLPPFLRLCKFQLHPTLSVYHCYACIKFNTINIA